MVWRVEYNRDLNILSLPGINTIAGFEIGKAEAEQIKKVIENNREGLQRIKSSPAKFTLARQIYEKIQKTFPDLIEELLGMAEGADVDFYDLFLINFPELLKKESGCTSMAVKSENRTFLIHNEDDYNHLTIDSYRFIEYRLENLSFTAFTLLGELSGNAFGWNDAGLFFCVNYLPPIKTDFSGIPRYFIARKLLEKTSIQQALSFLRKIKSASGFHYWIADSNTGEVVSIEESIDDLGVVRINEKRKIYHHSNHHIHTKFQQLTKYDAEYFDNSRKRLELIKLHTDKETTAEEALKIWRTAILRPMDDKDDSKTFATVLADITAKEINIYH